jgi:hypothetical protein
MRHFRHWLSGPLAGAALVAALQPGFAQIDAAVRPVELHVTEQGRVMAGAATSAKSGDRVPSSVQMVFGTQQAQPGVAACGPSRVLAAADAEALVRRIAEAERFYPDFVVAVARRESRFDAAALSPAGAYGLMQLMPATAERFGVDRCDPEENVRGGIRFLRHLWERLRNPFYILAAYNAGEDAVAAHRGVPPYPETVAFVAAVISDFYGYPPVGADASSGPSAQPASLAPGERPRATPASVRRPSSPTSIRQPRKAPPAQDWMVLHLE